MSCVYRGAWAIHHPMIHTISGILASSWCRKIGCQVFYIDLKLTPIQIRTELSTKLVSIYESVDEQGPPQIIGYRQGAAAGQRHTCAQKTSA